MAKSARWMSGQALALVLAAMPLDARAQPAPGGRPPLQFAVPAIDGKATLAGQIDFPADLRGKAPLVMLVPGTGVFDRKALFGDSKTDRDFVFEDLKNGLVAAGLAVLRFDLRGVRCTALDVHYPTGADGDARRTLYIESCIDNAVRKTVTPQTSLDDIAAVLAFGLRQPDIDAQAAVVLAHSEGTLHVAKLLQTAPRLVKGVVLVGPVLASPAATVRWQITDRIGEAMRALERQPGSLTADDIRAGYDRSILRLLGPIEHFLPPQGEVWTEADWDKARADRIQQYDIFKREALASDDDAPYPPSGPIVQASFAWWKMFFTDAIPVAERLADFPGSVHCIFGGRDSQTNYRFQIRSLESLRSDQRARFVVKVLEDYGHTLGEHPTFAPMAPDAKAYLVETVGRVARE
ncbi:MAG: alpha/beta hydrolase [Hyphomicrobiaceae bacterium]